MEDDGGVVRSTRTLTAEEQDALVSQCSRCVLRDSAAWVVPAAVLGLGVALATGTTVDVVAVLGYVVLALWGQVRATRRWWRAAHPVGTELETVLAPHRLTHLLGTTALPVVERVRVEGRVLRLDLGRDHTHVLPGHVDVALLRERAGAPAPAPARGPGVVVVPAGLGRRAAARQAVWSSLHSREVVWSWLFGAAALLVGLEGLAVTVLAGQVGALVVAAVVVRREFDRTLPAGVPLAPVWSGTDLVVRGAHGEWGVEVGPATAVVGRGDLVVVRRRGLVPMPLPAVLVDDAARASLLAN